MLKTVHAQSENCKLVELVNGRFAIIGIPALKNIWYATAKEAKQFFIDNVPMSETIQWFTDI